MAPEKKTSKSMSVSAAAVRKLGRPQQYKRASRFSSVFEADILNAFEDLVRSQGRPVNKALSELMSTYVSLTEPHQKNTTLEGWFQDGRFIATPQVFDGASVWDQYLRNNCTDHDLAEIYDQLDALKHAVSVQMAARRLKKTKAAFTSQNDNNNNTTSAVSAAMPGSVDLPNSRDPADIAEEIFSKAARERGLASAPIPQQVTTRK